MGVLLGIVLIGIAVALFLVVKKRWIDNSTLQILTNIAGIVALLAAIAVFIFPEKRHNDIVSLSKHDNIKSLVKDYPKKPDFKDESSQKSADRDQRVPSRTVTNSGKEKLIKEPEIKEFKPASSETDCTKARSLPECYEADIYARDDTVLKNVELSCGPKGNMVLFSDATIRFTKNLEDIRAGLFPESSLVFSCISQIDFLEMNEDELSAVDSYKINRSDYFKRRWHKIKITLFDGKTWEKVYIYDKCNFKSKYEVGPLDSVNPKTIIIRTKKNCN